MSLLYVVSLGLQVERSVALLKRLTGERGRWEQGSETFKNQMSTIIGDVLLMSAFMAYAGTAASFFVKVNMAVQQSYYRYLQVQIN